jgi:hypothetical protein
MACKVAAMTSQNLPGKTEEHCEHPARIDSLCDWNRTWHFPHVKPNHYIRRVDHFVYKCERWNIAKCICKPFLLQIFYRI